MSSLHSRDVVLLPVARKRGVSLLEVLISMFILLFGLLGVASLFPVGKYHVTQAMQYDRAAAVGQRALEEIRVRGLLRPECWYLQNGSRFVDQANWQSRSVFFDPLAVAPPANSITVAVANTSALQRVTWRDFGSSSNMTLATAEAIFSSHEDLSLELPAERTRPAVQRITAAEREYAGAYSWAFMAVPARNMGEGHYLVTVVVFRGRTPGAEWMSANSGAGISSSSGGFRIRVVGTVAQASKIKMGEWLLISLQNRPTRPNYFHWYRINSISANSSNGVALLQLQGIARTASYDSSIWATCFGSAVGIHEQVMRVDTDVDWNSN